MHKRDIKTFLFLKTESLLKVRLRCKACHAEERAAFRSTICSTLVTSDMVTLLVTFALISTEEVAVVGFSGVCITSVMAREVMLLLST
jgi:hypothetical protein